MSYSTSYEQEHFEERLDKFNNYLQQIEEAQEAINEAIQGIESIVTEEPLEGKSEVINTLDNWFKMISDAKDQLR